MSASEGISGGSHGHDEHHGPPPPPEPKTPMWLPALGAVLFLTAGLIWAFSGSSKPEGDESPAPAASASGRPG